jgi:lysophospholipase L1-like esterase
VKKLALAALCGVLCGMALRPHIGAALRALSPKSVATDPLGPLDPAAWRDKVDLFEHLDRAAGPHLVYLGDSITERTNAAEIRLPGNPRIVNRAVAGDTTDGVLTRIRRSFPRGTTVCFLLIGYNDLRRGRTPEDTARGVQAIVEYLLAERSVEHVVVEAVPPPRNESFTVVADLNARLERWAGARADVSFLDLFSALLAPDGKPDPAWFTDPIHLSGAGAVRRAALEAAHLRRLQMPPSDGEPSSPREGGSSSRGTPPGRSNGRLSSGVEMTFVAAAVPTFL